MKRTGLTRGKNKYNASRSAGYDSKAEREYSEVLELLKRAGEIREFQHHPPAVKLCGGYVKWRVDYRVVGANGEEYYVEVKGMPTEGYRIKLNIWKYERPFPLFVVTKITPLRFKVIEQVATDRIKEPT